jgi:hypothetical protein
VIEGTWFATGPQQQQLAAAVSSSKPTAAAMMPPRLAQFDAPQFDALSFHSCFILSVCINLLESESENVESHADASAQNTIKRNNEAR